MMSHPTDRDHKCSISANKDSISANKDQEKTVDEPRWKNTAETMSSTYTCPSVPL